MSVMRGLLVMLTAALLTACVAHGQQVKQTTTAGKDHRRFVNYSSHSADFFRTLMTGRVYVSEHASISGMVRGEIYHPDGRYDVCFMHKLLNKYTDSKGKWDIEGRGSSAVRASRMVGGKLGYVTPFYDSNTGELRLEAINTNRDSGNSD